MGAYSKGGLKIFLGGGFNIFLVVGHILVEIFLLVNVNYLLDALHTGNRIFFQRQAHFH